MKRRIILSLSLLFFLFTLGAGGTMYYIMRTTNELDTLISLHQVEIMRQNLVIGIQEVQTDLYVVGTVFGRNMDTIVDNVDALDESVQTCSGCHDDHSEDIRRRITHVEHLTEDYKTALSRFITASANRDRILEYQIQAANIGNDILTKTQEMTFIASLKLHERTVDALNQVNRSRVILLGTLVLCFLIALGIATMLTRRITIPISDLVNVARRLARGERGTLATYSGQDEFGELSQAFNEMSGELQETEQRILDYLKQLSGLYEVTLSIHSVLDIGEICRTLSKEIATLLGVEECGLILYDEAREAYVHRHPAFGVTREQGEGIRFSQESAQRLFDRSTGTTLLSNDCTNDSRVDPILQIGEGQDTMLLAWIYRKGRILGAIRTANKTRGIFVEEDAKLLSILASHMAVAMENSSLYGNLQTHLQELQDTQEQLVQSAKLAAIGELASNVAHEINNPLTSILGYTELMKDELDLESLQKDLAIIEQESLRAREIVRQLLEFARKRPLDVREVDVNNVIRDVTPLVKSQASFANVRIVEDLDELPSTLVDANQLKQVFINLTNNAIFAMQGTGGELTITTRQVAESLIIRFQDTGTGIPADVLPRIFEPFFSTKREKGTGLGLSISYSIVQNHGGKITAQSGENGGSTFTITLPVNNHPAT